MAADPIACVKSEVVAHVAEIRRMGAQLSQIDLHLRLEAIRHLAASHGLQALEGLARCSAQLALLPGHRTAMLSCLEHMDEALDSRSTTDCTAILAAVALRLH